MTAQRPRIAIAYDCLFPYTTGGGERQYRSFADWMVTRGNDVEYLTAVQWAEDEAPDAADFSVVPVAGRLRLYDDQGVRRPAAAIRFAFGLFNALRRRRQSYAAVLVSGLPVFNVFAARAALVGSHTPLVVDYLEVWGRRQWREYAGTVTGTAAWIVQRLAIALTPTATAHSQLTATRLRREGFRGRLLVSPGLLDPAPDSRVIPSSPADPPYVLYVGRHIPDKRVEALPAAVATARRALGDLRLIILGEGPTSPDVKAAVDGAGGRSWTDCPGFVSQAELDRLMAGAAVLVNPSRREGYGLVVVEAAAHGTPTVLVRDEGNASTELLDEGVNGTVARSADPSDLGAAIVTTVAAGAALRASTRAWYEEAIRTRTVERTVDAILDAVIPSSAPNEPIPARRARRTEGPS